MANPNNHGGLIGRLAAEPRVFKNNDGSHKISFTLFVDNNYKTDDEWESQAIPVEAFIRRNVNLATTPFAGMHTGDLIAINHHLEFQVYERGGETVRTLKAICDEVWFEESPKVRRERFEARQRRAAQRQQAPAQQQPIQSQPAQPVQNTEQVPGQAAAEAMMARMNSAEAPQQPQPQTPAANEAAWRAAQLQDEPPF